MKIGETQLIRYYGEGHCDRCCEVVHNHFFQCPVCKADRAPTDRYRELYDWVEDDWPVIIRCELCKSAFQTDDKSAWFYDPDGVMMERVR